MPVTIPGSITLTDDFESTSATDPCLRLVAASATLNCNGHEIRCNNAAGCAGAISVEENADTVRNCRVRSLAGDWSIGILSTDTSFVTTVVNDVVANATFGVVLGKTIKQNVFTGIKTQCITSGLAAFQANTLIRENSCQSANDGLGISGPASGTAVQVEQNYVRADDVGLIQGSGLVVFEKNIVDAPTFKAFGDPGKASLVHNICRSTDCPNPDDYPFGLNLTINFR